MVLPEPRNSSTGQRLRGLRPTGCVVRVNGEPTRWEPGAGDAAALGHRAPEECFGPGDTDSPSHQAFVLQGQLLFRNSQRRGSSLSRWLLDVWQTRPWRSVDRSVPHILGYPNNCGEARGGRSIVHNYNT